MSFDKQPRPLITGLRHERSAELHRQASWWMIVATLLFVDAAMWVILGVPMAVGTIAAGLGGAAIVVALVCEGRAAYFYAREEAERREHLAKLKGMS